MKNNIALYPARAEPRGSAILLHGLGSCAEDWALQIPVLRQHYTVVAPDLPGHGRSQRLPGWPTIELMGAQVLDMLAGLEDAGQITSPLHVAGLSLGGAVALQMAIQAADRVRSLTLINTFARLHQDPRARLHSLVRLSLLLLGRMDLLGRWVAGGLFPGPSQAEIRQVAAERVAGNSRRAYLQAGLAVARFDMRSNLGSIAAPTLVIAGEADGTVSMRCKLEIAESVPGARLLCLTGSGHASPYDAPLGFRRAMMDFWAEVESADKKRMNLRMREEALQG